MALNDSGYFAFKSDMGQNRAPSLNLSIWILISGARVSFLRLCCSSDDTGWLPAEGWDHGCTASTTSWNSQGNFIQVEFMCAHVEEGFISKGNSDPCLSPQGINEGNKERNCIINGVKQRYEGSHMIKMLCHSVREATHDTV